MRLFFLLLFLATQVAVSAQPKALLHKPYAEKFYYTYSLYLTYDVRHKDDYFKNLAYLSKWAADNNDPELSCELDLLAVRSRIYDIEYPAALVDGQLNELSSKVKNASSELLSITYIQLVGIYYWNKQKNHNLAFENYINAYNLYKDVKAEDYPQKREYTLNLAMAFYVYDDIDKAIRYLKEALDIPAGKTKTLEIQIYNSLGLCYRKQNKFDSSIYYFRKIYDKGDEEWIGITSGNMGINYYLQKNYNEAIPLLEKEVAISTRNQSNMKSAVNSLNILSRIATIKNESDKAEQYIQQAKQICDQRNFWRDYQISERVYFQLHAVYTLKGNYQLANRYADSEMVAKDSFLAQYNAANLARATEKTEFVQHKLDTEKLVNQKKMHELIRNSLLAGALLLVIICILYINRQRLKQKQLMAQQQIAEADLVAAAQNLDTFRQSAQEKNQLIEHFTTELEKLKQTEAEQSDNEIRSQLERAIILTDEQWDDFRDLFEQVNKGFFGGLKKKYPDLTQAEIRFLALSKMKLTSKEMASMLGISVNAIRMNRHRLRKKLELDKDDMIEELVDNI